MDLVRYNDSVTIGTVNMTPEQLQAYEGMAQQPEGLVPLGGLPSGWYELYPEYQGTSEDTTVYIE